MTNTILYAGGEDIDFTLVGTPAPTVVLNTTHFRPNARCAIELSYSPANQYIRTNSSYSINSSTPTPTWWSAFIFWAQTTQPTVTSVYNSFMMRWVDSGGTPRILIAPALTGTWNPVGPYAVYTYDGTTLTQLGLSFSMALTSHTLSKIDVQLHYAILGGITIYVNGTQVFSYLGDITAGSTGVDLVATDYANIMGDGTGPMISGNPTSYGTTSWSEVIVSSSDTRPMTLLTLAPNGVAASGLAQWTGNYHNVNSIITNYASGITSATSGAIDDFSLSSFSLASQTVTAVLVVAEASIATGSPQNINLGIRLNTTDYFSTNLAVSTTFARYSFDWETNPNTTNPWLFTDLATLGTSVENFSTSTTTIVKLLTYVILTAAPISGPNTGNLGNDLITNYQPPVVCIYSSPNAYTPLAASRLYDADVLFASVDKILNTPSRTRLFHPQGFSLKQRLYTVQAANLAQVILNDIYDNVTQDPRLTMLYNPADVTNDLVNQTISISIVLQMLAISSKLFTRQLILQRPEVT